MELLNILKNKIDNMKHKIIRLQNENEMLKQELYNINNENNSLLQRSEDMLLTIDKTLSTIKNSKENIDE